MIQNRLARSEKFRRLIFSASKPALTVISIVPSRILFAFLVFFALLRFPGRWLLPKIVSPIALRRLRRKPSLKFSSLFTRIFPRTSAYVLFYMGVFAEAIQVIKLNALQMRNRELALLLAKALFELGEFDEARDCLKYFIPRTSIIRNPSAMQLLAHLELLDGMEDSAGQLLDQAAVLDPAMLCPHHNLSARYPAEYVPTELDIASGTAGRLYDAYNFLGQRVTHVGRGDLARKLYRAAFRAQDKLRTSEIILSDKCKELLLNLRLRLNNVRILPSEWFSQIGHEGMLDMLFRMRELGWWKGQAIMLVPSQIVANHQFLSLFDKEGKILLPGVDVDDVVAAELFSLQRLCGMSFNAFLLPSNEVALWQEAGALLLRQWETEGRGYPVRDEFDRRAAESKLTQSSIEQIKKSWGMGPDDWYVCLHLRDSSHYNEAAGTGQAHRNTATKNYLRAIKHITDKGGWVVKLGGSSSPKLPRMARVIDYARGNYRSEMLDLVLIRNARYFIGTTSGLTNVAISFGVPSALVNCITTDAQLWGDRVRFILKTVRHSDGRLITQRELTSTPWRWRTFSADVLAHHGALFQDNTPDEILETVKEVEMLANGEVDEYASTIPDAEMLMRRWQACLKLPYFYGNAKPSLYFIKKHEKEYLADVSHPPVSSTENAAPPLVLTDGQLSVTP